MKTAQDVIDADLQYICNNLRSEFSQMSGKKLLIIGGAGFLGYYLVQSVLYWNKISGLAPIALTVYDNYIRGIPDWLTSLESDENLVLKKHDITHPLPEDIDDFQFIIHAASIASPTFYRKYPIETMDANVNGLRTLLEYCKQHKEAGKPVEGFLFYSTSEIYGDPTPENIPTPETYRGNVSCTGPRACYDESKRYGETLCVNFAEQYELPIKIARPFNNYGPGLSAMSCQVEILSCSQMVRPLEPFAISRMRSSGTTKFSSLVVQAKPTTSALRRQKSQWQPWQTKLSNSLKSCLTTAARSCGKSATTKPTW
jgi:UDP-glucuronate decarboxylase